MNTAPPILGLPMVQVPENNQKKTGAAGKKRKVSPQEQRVSFFTFLYLVQFRYQCYRNSGMAECGGCFNLRRHFPFVESRARIQKEGAERS